MKNKFDYTLDCWDFKTTQNSIINIFGLKNETELNNFLIRIEYDWLDEIDEIGYLEQFIGNYLVEREYEINLNKVMLYHRTRWFYSESYGETLCSNVEIKDKIFNKLKTIVNAKCFELLRDLLYVNKKNSFCRDQIKFRMSLECQKGPYFFLFGDPAIFKGPCYGSYLKKGSELIEMIFRAINEELGFDFSQDFYLKTKPIIIKSEVLLSHLCLINKGIYSKIGILSHALKFLISFKDSQNNVYDETYCVSLEGRSNYGKIVEIISI